MALARLTKQCRECPFVETCEHKEMEALGYLPEPIMADVKAPVTADIAAPILRETVSHVVDGKVVTMYKDELEKILYKDLYSHLGLQCYSEEVKRKIAQAKSVYEIGRILKQARLNQE